MTSWNKEAPERQEIEALLPWHAAGTLSRRDSEKVEKALAGDRELARRFDLVREEHHETIHLNESLGAPSARAMEKLFAAIEADTAKAPRRRSFDFASRIAEFVSGFAPRTVAYAAAAAALALFVQGAVLLSLVVKDHNGGNIELASYEVAPGLAVVRFVPQATVGEITRFLQAYGAVVVEGPQKGGLFNIRIGAGNLPQPEVSKIVQRMQSETKVVEFIAARQ